MNGRTSRVLLTAAAAGAVLAGLSPSAASAAPAARPRGVGSHIYAATHAGYRAGFGTGWRFRFAAATFTIPACSAESTMHGWTGNTVELGSNGSLWRASLGGGCDPGGASAGAPVDYLLVQNGHGVMPVDIGLRPLAGHQVVLSVFYNRRAHKVQFVAGDNTSHDAIVRTIDLAGAANFYGAEVGSQFAGTITSPLAPLKSGVFSDIHLTTYSGRRGTMLGRWTTNQVIATVGGAPDGDVIANAPTLWNRGRNFTVYQRIIAHGPTARHRHAAHKRTAHKRTAHKPTAHKPRAHKATAHRPTAPRHRAHQHAVHRRAAHKPAARKDCGTVARHSGSNFTGPQRTR